MTRKQSYTSRPAKPPEADDLKLIDGIGPAVEKRLHRVGIFTFAQLSTLSPADIAAAVMGIAGLSAERITKQDWILQARKLALQSTSTEMPKEAEASIEHLHEATFTIKFLLDEENEVNSTHIVHMQSAAEQSWSGWQETQLVRFLALYANPRLQPVGIVAPLTGEAESPAPIVTKSEPPKPEVEEVATSAPVVDEIEPPAPVSHMNNAANPLHLSKPQIVLSDTHVPQNMLRTDQPYEVHFTLHLVPAMTSPTSTLNYTALAYGWTVDQWIRHPIGVVQGTIRPSEEITATIRGALLPQGTYWLEAEALATLTPALQEISPGQELLATVKGHLFEIY